MARTETVSAADLYSHYLRCYTTAMNTEPSPETPAGVSYALAAALAVADALAPVAVYSGLSAITRMGDGGIFACQHEGDAGDINRLRRPRSLSALVDEIRRLTGQEEPVN